MSEEIYDPRERLEIFLNAVRTGDVEDLPDPQTREEMYLAAIAAKSDLPDTTEASVGDALVLDEDKKPTWAAAGAKKYVNNIYSTNTGWGFHCSIITTEQLNYAKFARYLYSIGATYIAQAYPATGYNPDKKSVIGVFSTDGTAINVLLIDGNTPTTHAAIGGFFTFENIEI